jgi:5-formyltetrahydrofolate cyclo-ligase
LSEGNQNHEKAHLREELLLQRLRFSDELRAELSLRASDRLLRLPFIAQASTIAFYAAVGSEADPSSAIEACKAAGKRVVFPRCSGEGRVLHFAAATLDELVPGTHRTREPPAVAPPVSPGEIDCIVVPGVAFDLHCRRLGRGGGFYDATLAAFSTRASRIGFAFDAQVVSVVPSEGHDIPMDVVVTDARVLHAANAAGTTSH